MGWRHEEVWFDVDVSWFGEGGGAPAIAGLALPPLPRFGPHGLVGSQLRREAWKRRRRARAAALAMVPAVVIPSALARGGAATGRVLAEDPPSLTVELATRVRSAAGLPTASRPERPVQRPVAADPSPALELRNATSIGFPWSGSLVDGTPLPVEGPDWVTWNHPLDPPLAVDVGVGDDWAEAKT